MMGWEVWRVIAELAQRDAIIARAWAVAWPVIGELAQRDAIIARAWAIAYYDYGGVPPTRSSLWWQVSDISLMLAGLSPKKNDYATIADNKKREPTIYLVEQIFKWKRLLVESRAMQGRPDSEAIRAFRELLDAKIFCKERAGVLTWQEHDAHGRSWESLDGHGKYVIVEIALETKRDRQQVT